MLIIMKGLMCLVLLGLVLVVNPLTPTPPPPATPTPTPAEAADAVAWAAVPWACGLESLAVLLGIYLVLRRSPQEETQS